ncbi:MAG TPA: alpha/beta fold hydrolase [Candidatus Acidoferrales bacterium]|nr:alpha/beta fold hydrolase [Candidatus Acidoferrales bacterium]
MKRFVRACATALTLTLVMSSSVAAADFREEPLSVAIPVGTLSGTLVIPSGNGPFTVALIVAGSGPTDRNGNNPMGVRSDTYEKLADGLAEHGIATLRYDKRMIGASTVHQEEKDLRFDDYVDDALALLGVLEKDPRFDRVAIIGHSEGSLIGMLAAQRDPHVAAFVSLEGAGRDLATVLDEQVRANPVNPESVIQEVVHYDALLRAGKTIPDPDPSLAALFRPSVQPYLISEYKYDPAKEIGKLTIPVLIVHGTTDMQVAGADAEALAAGDPKARVAIIDGMNHVLVDAPADREANLATYSQPGLPLAATLVSTIATFLTTAGRSVR